MRMGFESLDERLNERCNGFRLADGDAGAGDAF